MTKDELLKALLVERQDQTWWPTPTRDTGSVAALAGQSHMADDDLTTARRRRELAAEFAAHDQHERKAT